RRHHHQPHHPLHPARQSSLAATHRPHRLSQSALHHPRRHEVPHLRRLTPHPNSSTLNNLVISTEATHGFIVSCAAEKSASLPLSFPRIAVYTPNHAIAVASVLVLAVILSEAKDPDTLDQPSPPILFNPTLNRSCFPNQTTAENHHHYRRAS